MSSSFPAPKENETTSLRELVERFSPTLDDTVTDETTRASIQYMRGLMQDIGAENTDILDQRFDESQSLDVTSSLWDFCMGDLITALSQLEEACPDKKTLTLADIVEIAPAGIAHKLAMDVRRRIKAFCSN